MKQWIRDRIEIFRTWFRKNYQTPPSGAPVCPYCHGVEWYEGPSGGMSTNIMCKRCEHWFNYHQGIIPMDDLYMKGRNRERTPRP